MCLRTLAVPSGSKKKLFEFPKNVECFQYAGFTQYNVTYCLIRCPSSLPISEYDRLLLLLNFVIKMYFVLATLTFKQLVYFSVIKHNESISEGLNCLLQSPVLAAYGDIGHSL